MADNMFSWQKGDFEKLCIALTSDSKVLFIHTRDFESPFHVLTSFSTYLTENEYALFDINPERAAGEGGRVADAGGPL